MKTFKTGKKLLSVLLSMLIVMTSCATVSPALAAEEHEHIFKYAGTEAVTCTTDGYDLYICTNGCTAYYKENIVKAEGHTFKDEYKAPTCEETGGIFEKCSVCGHEGEFSTFEDMLGHDFSKWYFEAQSGGAYYYNKRNCGRPGCGCYEYETDGESKAKYYKVDFKNDWVAKKFYTAEDGTKLAYAEWSEDNYTTDITTVYVKQGDAAVYSGANAPSKYRTVEFGKYNFMGWTLSGGDGTVFDTYENVQSNLTLKAVFDGEKVTHQVVFAGYDATKPLEGESFQFLYQHVAHGDEIQYNPSRYCVPQHPDKQSLYYNYSFNGWDLTYDPDAEKVLVNDPTKNYKYGDNITTIKIYSDHTINPEYESIPKKYKVVFHDASGKVIINEKTGENGVVFEYATRPEWVPEVALPNDHANYYAWGVKDFTEYKWKDAKGNAVDVSCLLVPTGTPEYDREADLNNPYIEDIDKGIIHLYPNIISMAKSYSINLYVMDIDGETPAEGATVQVTDIVGENQAAHLIGTPYTLNEHGFAKLNIPYGEGTGLDIRVYKVTATLDGRTCEGYITETHIMGAIEGDSNKATLNLKLLEPTGDDKDKGCTCICHSFIGKFYITFLNLIYKLFDGTKIVCCYDMYIRHGDKLAYTK